MYNELCVLNAFVNKVNARSMNSKQIQTVEANGTLDNIKLCSSLNFRDNKDQKLPFIIIVSAFVIKLYMIRL